MTENPEPTISVRVDPANPGQFFACCGLLELADRLWRGAEGWFDDGDFLLRPLECGSSEDRSLGGLVCAIAAAPLRQIDEQDQYASPLELEAPFGLRLDWWKDDQAGGAVFKSWAGQQSVFNIACGLQSAIHGSDRFVIAPKDLMIENTCDNLMPFNFDSILAVSGSDIDLGFSLDPLKNSRISRIPLQIRPTLEFLAFVGLQRFRPQEIDDQRPRRRRQYRYTAWPEPLRPQIAASVAGCAVFWPKSRRFEFRILYRTDYLKTFLPATFVGA